MVAGNKTRFLRNLFVAMIGHDIFTLAAALAFYTALSLAPILLLVTGVLGFFGSDAEHRLMSEIDALMGSQAAEAVKIIVESSANRPLSGSTAGLISLLAIVFSASGVFSQLQSSLNIIWGSQATHRPGGLYRYLKDRLFSVGIVVVFIFLAVISLAVSLVLSALLPEGQEAWHLTNGLISLGIFSYLFGLVFRYLPNERVGWSEALFGGLLTSILFAIGKFLIGLYLGNSAIGSAYGAAGSLIVLLTWVYYSSIIVFVGAEFTRAAFVKNVAGKLGS